MREDEPEAISGTHCSESSERLRDGESVVSFCDLSRDTLSRACTPGRCQLAALSTASDFFLFFLGGASYGAPVSDEPRKSASRSGCMIAALSHDQVFHVTKEPTRLSRRELFVAGAAAAIGGAMGGAFPMAAAAQVASNAAAGEADEELVLVNGKIHTMDGKNTIAATVSIRNGRFSAVDGPAPAPRPGTRVIDLRGRTVVPGIIDNHNHIVLMGNRPGYHVPLENASSIADVQELVAARARAIPRSAWITTIGGFHRNQLFPTDATPRLPTRAELDAAAPDNPVYISESFMGPSTANSVAKAFFERQAPPIIVGDDGAIAAGQAATGRATLTLRQTLLTFEQRKRGASEAMTYGLGLGVTTHLDQGAFQRTNTPNDGAAHEDNYTMHLPFVALRDDGKLPARLRINFLH